MVPISPVSVLDLVPVGYGLLEAGFGFRNINMVADCYRWSQVLLNVASLIDDFTY